MAVVTKPCGAPIEMWEGKYEGECELPVGHDGAHWDGLTSWRTTQKPGTEPTYWDIDWDTRDDPEDRARFT